MKILIKYPRFLIRSVLKTQITKNTYYKIVYNAPFNKLQLTANTEIMFKAKVLYVILFFTKIKKNDVERQCQPEIKHFGH